MNDEPHEDTRAIAPGEISCDCPHCGGALAVAVPRGLNPTSAELFAAMREKAVTAIVIAASPDDRFEVWEKKGDRDFKTWPEVLTHLGLYTPPAALASQIPAPKSPEPNAS